MSGLEAAASAVAIATLAQQTAFLIGKIYNARRDADQLQSKTQNLSHLLKNVARCLERRNARLENREPSEHDREIELNIQTTLRLCESCVQGIHTQFKHLIEKDNQRSSAVLIQSLKFVRRHKYIAEQERDITMHVSTLSMLLQLLQYDERDQLSAQNAAEQQRREQWTQTQSEIHVDFLRQLFLLLQYVFQVAAQSQSDSHSHQGAILPTSDTTPQATNYHPRSIGLGETEATLENLFGNLSVQPSNHSDLEDYVLDSTHRAEDGMVQQENHHAPDNLGPRSTHQLGNGVIAVRDSSHKNNANVDVDVDVDVDIISKEALDAELSSLNQVRTRDMSDYANGNTLFLAVKSGSIDLVSSLIDQGASTSLRDQYNWTILHHAVFCLNVGMVDLLLTHEGSKCAQPDVLNAQTQTSETALIFAVQRANTIEGFEISQALLDQPQCDINISDGRGSALYYAVSEGKPSSKPRRSLVESLAEKEADVEKVNQQVPEQVRNYEILSKYIKGKQIEKIEAAEKEKALGKHPETGKTYSDNRPSTRPARR